MDQQLNAKEVFEIAQQIEIDGAVFYRAAAELFNQGTVHDTLLKLADWEVEHEKKFAEMEKSFSSEKQLEPKEDGDIEAIAALSTFVVRRAPASDFNKNTGKAEIIEKAIRKEQDTIIFYRGLKNFILDVSAEAVIDNILKQEFEHIEILKNLLARQF